MTDVEALAEVDELGPVDYLVVELPAGRSTFSGEVAMELAALVDAGVIRLLDLLVLEKSASGSVEAFEIDDLDHAEEIHRLQTGIAEILADQDVSDLAASMLPGTVAAVLVWENTWAAPFASAARRAGGQLIAGGRISVPSLAASIAADLDDGAA